MGVLKVSISTELPAMRRTGGRNGLPVRGNGDAVDPAALGEVQITQPGDGAVGQGKAMPVEARLGWRLRGAERWRQ
jgi:hypothetical protein